MHNYFILPLFLFFSNVLEIIYMCIMKVVSLPCIPSYMSQDSGRCELFFPSCFFSFRIGN